MVLMVIALNLHPPRSFLFRSFLLHLRLEVVKFDGDAINPKDCIELCKHKVIFENTFAKNFDGKMLKVIVSRITLDMRYMEHPGKELNLKNIM